MESQLLEVSVGLAAATIILKVVFDFIVRFRDKPAIAEVTANASVDTLTEINDKLTQLLTDIGVLKTQQSAANDHGVSIDRRLDSLDERVRAVEVKVG